MVDQWMNDPRDQALFHTNSEEEIVIVQSKSHAHEQAHWRVTIMSIAKTPAFRLYSSFLIKKCSTVMNPKDVIVSSNGKCPK